MRILFIDIDTLRPDHMSCYGYDRLTTPNIDKVAAQGVKYSEYYCSDAPCLPSRAALITGMHGIRNGVIGHGGTCADIRIAGRDRGFRDSISENNFHYIFRKAGMRTASVSTFAERHSAWWFNAGLNEVYNVGKRGMESGELVLPVAMDWLERNGNTDNWFLHVHFWDPHTPYRAPESFGNPFADVPLNNWINEDVFNLHKKHIGPHSVNELSMYTDEVSPMYPRHPGRADNLTELKRVFDGYDCGILYADTLIGQIFDRMRAMGIYDDTAIIVTSDHGENMGELGIYSEHGTADRGTCRIPMIIKWLGGATNHVDNDLHLNLDIAPTMAELLDVPAYPKWDGVSYAPSIIKAESCGRDYAVISQNAHVCQRSVRFGEWLYIRTYHDGFHLFDREMLFNMHDDPYEQFDLKNERPDIVAKGAKLILDWHDEMMQSSDSDIDPMWTVMKEGGPHHTLGGLDQYLIRLENTGRKEGARLLREKYKAK